MRNEISAGGICRVFSFPASCHPIQRVRFHGSANTGENMQYLHAEMRELPILDLTPAQSRIAGWPQTCFCNR